MADDSSSAPPPTNPSALRRRTVPGDDAPRSSADAPTTVGGERGDAISPPPNFKAPQPKRFKPRRDKFFDIFTAGLGAILRFTVGVFVNGYARTSVPKNEFPSGKYALERGDKMMVETSKPGRMPEKPIEIYEYEGCPYCRKVREIVAVLDLDILYYPCPKKGPNFRLKVAEMGGKQQFPYMVDPNTGVSMYESDGIIKYLVEKYGNGKVPLMLSLGPVTTLSAALAEFIRFGKGKTYIPAKMPPKPLEIWAYEGSPFCKIAREALVELELPHLCRSCARGSPKRQILFDKVGLFQAPYLEDPNTGVAMFESAEIIEYLRATYAL